MENKEKQIKLEKSWTSFFDTLKIKYTLKKQDEKNLYHLSDMDIDFYVIPKEEAEAVEAETKRLGSVMEFKRATPEKIVNSVIATGYPHEKNACKTFGAVHHEMKDGSQDTRLTGVDTEAKAGLFMTLGGKPYYVVEGFTNKDHFDGSFISVADSMKKITKDDQDKYIEAVNASKEATEANNESIFEDDLEDTSEEAEEVQTKPEEKVSPKEEVKKEVSEQKQSKGEKVDWLTMLPIFLAGLIIGYDYVHGYFDTDFLKQAFIFSVIFATVNRSIRK